MLILLIADLVLFCTACLMYINIKNIYTTHIYEKINLSESQQAKAQNGKVVLIKYTDIKRYKYYRDINDTIATMNKYENLLTKLD